MSNLSSDRSSKPFSAFPNKRLPLFTRIFGPFSKEYLIKSIRKALLNAGINPNGFSGHSLRRGAAISADAAQIPRDEIKILGRWKSDTVDLYFENNPATILQHSKSLHSAP